ALPKRKQQKLQKQHKARNKKKQEGNFIMGKYFGTDGVRGIANQELTPELAFKLGRCGGYVLSRHEQEDVSPRVLVARDTRASGQLLETALISGLLSVGIEVFQLGVISTPGVAYL